MKETVRGSRITGKPGRRVFRRPLQRAPCFWGALTRLCAQSGVQVRRFHPTQQLPHLARCTIGQHPLATLVGLSIQVSKQPESCRENCVARLALAIMASIQTHDISHAVLYTHVGLQSLPGPKSSVTAMCARVRGNRWWLTFSGTLVVTDRIREEEL